MGEPCESRVRYAEVEESWRESSASLTTRIRRLVRAAALTGAGMVTLDSVAARVDLLSSELERVQRSGVLVGDFDQGGIAVDGFRSIGSHNGRVIPLEIEFRGDRAEATFTAVELLEGAPGLLHGGEAAWLMDCMCGLLVEEVAANSPRTANLTLDYLAPTPIGVALTMKSAIAEREGRKLWVDASIEADGVVTVEARGLFVTPRV